MLGIIENLLLKKTKKVSLLILVFFTLICVPAIIFVSQIKTQYTLDQFQPSTHARLDINKRVDDTFLLSKNYPYLIALSIPEGKGQWIDIEHMQKLDEITEKVNSHEDIDYTTSLSNINTAIIKNDNFILGPGKQLAENTTTLTNPLLTPHFLTQDGRHTTILVMPNTIDNDKMESLLEHLEDSTKNLDYTVQIGGPSAVSTQMTRLLKKEVTLFAVISFLIVVLTLSTMFKGWSAAFICLCLAFVANLMGLAFMSLLGLPLTVLTNTVPILITITVVAIASHTLLKLTQKPINPTQRTEKIIATFKELFVPHLLTALTTSIGFGTLAFSKVFVISAYGKSVSASVLLACLVTIIVLPALLLLLPLPQPRKFSFSHNKWIHYILNHRVPILLVILATFAAMSVKGRQLNWSASLFDELPYNNPSRQASLFLDEHLGGTIPLNITLTSKEKGAWQNPENLKAMDQLIERINKEKLSPSTMGLTDFVKSARVDKKLPQTTAATEQIYFLYAMGEENPLDQFITPDRSSARLSMRLRDIPSLTMRDDIKKIKSYAQELFPDMEVLASGAAASIHIFNEEMSEELIFGFFEALMWIFLLLTLIFRSLAWPLLSVIPNLLPPVFLLGGLAITKTPIKPHIAMIFTISLGIAFDNTVYILSRLKTLIQESNGQWPSIQKLMVDEASPCFISSFSLFLGFSTFLFSYFKINQVFGAFMLLSIASGLVGDLILLPIILKQFPGLKNFLQRPKKSQQ